MFGTISEAIEKLQAMKDQSEEVIMRLWHVEDVMEVENRLTPDQARRALALADKCHDAEIGINLDSLQSAADEVVREDGCSK